MEPLSALEQKKLDLLRRLFGEMTHDEALRLSLESDQWAKDVGPFDPTYTKFVSDRETMLQYACLLERNK